MLQVLLASEQLHIFCIEEQVVVLSYDEVPERLGDPFNIHQPVSFCGEQRLFDNLVERRERQVCLALPS